MRKALLFLALLVSSFKVSSQTILAEYNFDASSLVPTNFAGGLVTASNVTYTNVNLAGFANGVTLMPDMAPYFNQWPSAPIIIDPTKFLEITITSNPGITVQVNRIRLWERFMNNGPSVLTLRSSSDGFSSNVYQNGSGSATFWEYHDLAIGPFTISNGASISFRIYAGATNSNPGSTFSIDSVHIEGQDITTLPIELISFGGSVAGNSVELRWVTASETNNDYFTVYRAQNLEDWEEVGTVEGAGESASSLWYSLTDESPHQGVNYYKLRQTDTDGFFEEFPPTAVLYSGSKDATVYRAGELIQLQDPAFVVDGSGRIVGDVSDRHVLDKPGTYIFVGQTRLTILITQ